MAQETLRVGIVVARRRTTGLWGAESWLPVAALDLPECSALPPQGDGDLRVLGGVEIELHAGQTAHYLDNLGSGRPALWVGLWLCAGEPRLGAVTLDPYEGEAMAEGIGEIVEAVAMPHALRLGLGDFVARWHVERPFIKRQRDRIGNREAGGPPSRRC